MSFAPPAHVARLENKRIASKVRFETGAFVRFSDAFFDHLAFKIMSEI